LRFTKDALKYIDGRIPFIVNDRLDIALAAGADGVHLGQEDLPVPEARKIAPRQLIIGASCQTPQQVMQAQAEGADYIGFGAVFKTPTKPENKEMDLASLTEAVRIAKIPVFAIGGINLENLPILKGAGIKRIAVIRAICCAPNVDKATRSFLDKL
jgi:thiamine-phosphate pyrophosphorylase